MSLRWEDERYVRFYTRDTTDWLLLSWKAQGLLGLIFRKVDRAGVLDLGKSGKRGICVHIGGAAAWSEIEPALDELLADGCVEIRGVHLIVPNFIEAQEATISDAQRKREQRARARDLTRFRALTGQDVPQRDEMSDHETETSRPVTSGHVATREVTPIRSVPSDPIRTESTQSRARVMGAWKDAGLPGLPSAQHLEDLARDLATFTMTPEQACKGWKTVLDAWAKKSIVCPATTEKMRVNLSTIQRLVDGELKAEQLSRSANGKHVEQPEQRLPPDISDHMAKYAEGDE